MKYRNAKRKEDGSIDCEIDHPRFGWIPYTVSTNDKDQTVDNVALLKAMEAGGNVAEYVEAEPQSNEVADLSPLRFAWLLAFTGIEDVWADLELAMKDKSKEIYAMLRAQRFAQSYSQEKTLYLVSQFRDEVSVKHPQVDISEAAIKAAWDRALNEVI